MDTNETLEEEISIIVIEDDPSLSRLMRRKLLQYGRPVERAYTGQEGIAIAKKIPKALLILDYSLPDMTAKEVIDTLTEKKCFHPFIIVTGDGDEIVAVNMMKMGAKDYLLKDSHLLGNLPRVVERAVKDYIREEKLQRTEEALRESERTLQEFLEAIPLGLFVVKSNGQPHYANSNAQSLLGKGIVDNNEKTYSTYLAESDELYPKSKLPINFALKGQKTTVDNVIVQHPDRKIPIEVWGAPVYDKNRQLKYAISTFMDITDRKKKEREIYLLNEQLEKRVISRTAQLLEMNRTLKNSESKAQLLKEIAIGSNDLDDFDEVFLQALKGITDYINWPLGHVTLLDQTLDLISANLWYSKYPENFKELEKLSSKVSLLGKMMIAQVISHKKPMWISDITEYKNAIDNQCLINLNVRTVFAVPLLINDRVVALLEIFSTQVEPYRDGVIELVSQVVTLLEIILNRKQVEREILTARKAAEEANQAKSDFLANISHEIRTPMNAVIGMTHLLEYTNLSEKQKDYQNKINQAAHHLLSIINKVLDFSKIEAGKLSLESIDFHLEKVLRKLFDFTLLKAQEKNLKVLLFLDPKVPLFLKGDPLRLNQILTNLVGNAIKYTNKGHIEISIEVVETTASELTLSFTVQDTGIGLTSQEITKLFKPFSQADTSISRKYGGTGLGLTICRQLVHMMEGEIHIESEKGKGSAFRFIAKFLLQNENEKKLQIPENLNSIKVLIIDKYEPTRNNLTKLFQSFGLETFSRNCEIEHLESRREDKFPYDLIVMNWDINEKNNTKLINQIRKNIPSQNQPAIILYNDCNLEDFNKEKKDIPEEAFLAVPFFPSALREMIITLFSNSKVFLKKSRESSSKKLSKKNLLHKAKILVVEDNKLNQEVIEELIKTIGGITTLVNNGKEAVETLKVSQFDCILMDIQMPGLNGYETTELIRKNGLCQKTPIIALTANIMEGDREKCLACGMNDYISKPLDIKKLYLVISKQIQVQNEAKLTLPGQLKSSSSHSSQPELETKAAIKRVGNNHKLYQRLLTRFIQHYSGYITEINDAFDENNLEAAENMLHSLKGVAGNIGATELYNKINDLEVALKTKSESYIPYKEALTDAFERLLVSIRIAIKENKIVESSLPVQLRIQETQAAPLLAKIAELLENYDTEVRDHVEKLKGVVTTGKVLKELIVFEKKVAEYNFEEALVYLYKMAEGLNISLVKVENVRKDVL